MDHLLKVEANVNGLLIDAKTLRTYFGIEYFENLGDILSRFADRLNDFIPAKVPKSYFNDQKKAMIASLSKSASEDLNKIYCFAVKRNAKISKRSEFNGNKAHLLRSSLFEKYKDDDSIRFCFSNNKEVERTDSEIMQSFSQNH